MLALPAGTTAAEDKEAKENAANIYLDMIVVRGGCDCPLKRGSHEGYMLNPLSEGRRNYVFCHGEQCLGTPEDGNSC